jgi:hypothetical protein
LNKQWKIRDFQLIQFSADFLKTFVSRPAINEVQLVNDMKLTENSSMPSGRKKSGLVENFP